MKMSKYPWRSLLITLGFLISWASQAYSPEPCEYEIKENEVYYCKSKVDGADASSLKDFGKELNDWAQDKNSVYYQGAKVPDVVPPLVSINDSYFKNKKNVYYLCGNEKILCQIEAKVKDPIRLYILSDFLSVGKMFFYRGQLLDKMNGYKAKELNHTFSTDGRVVYASSKLLTGINAKNLSLVYPQDGHLISDGKKVFYEDQELAHADAPTLKIVSKNLLQDKKRTYVLAGGALVPKSLAGFTELDQKELTDILKSKGIEIDSKLKIIERVNSSPFLVGGQNFYFSKDKSHVYFEHHIIPDVDLDSFEVLEYKKSTWGKRPTLYSKDKNHVYFMNTKLEGVNPKKIKLEERAFGFQYYGFTAEVLVAEGRSFICGYPLDENLTASDYLNILLKKWYLAYE